MKIELAKSPAEYEALLTKAAQEAAELAAELKTATAVRLTILEQLDELKAKIEASSLEVRQALGFAEREIGSCRYRFGCACCLCEDRAYYNSNHDEFRCGDHGGESPPKEP